jgi:hypothetical protein
MPGREGDPPVAADPTPNRTRLYDRPGSIEDMTAALARNWWAIALRGVFAILFGAIALVLPGVTIASLLLLFAAYMIVDGILAIVAAIRAARRHERWWFLKGSPIWWPAASPCSGRW